MTTKEWSVAIAAVCTGHLEFESKVEAVRSMLDLVIAERFKPVERTILGRMTDGSKLEEPGFSSLKSVGQEPGMAKVNQTAKAASAELARQRKEQGS